MIKKAILLLVLAAATSGASAQAEEKPKLGVTLDYTYVSRHIWRGMDGFPNNHSASQASIDIDFYGTGFGLNVWGARANASGFENAEEIDYTAYYYNRLFEGQKYVTEYTIGLGIYTFPDQPRTAAEYHEVFLNLRWPELLPWSLAPGYTVVATWPGKSDSAVADYSGWVHIFSLGCDLPIRPKLPKSQCQNIHLCAEIVYNDGAYGDAVDHDWTHMLFGISTDFDLGNSLVFTPGFWYQSSWDDSINTQDEYWTSLSIKYTF